MSNPPALPDPTSPSEAPTDRLRRTALLASAGVMLFGGPLTASFAARANPTEADRGDRADPGEAARLSALCSSANAIGVGLRGEYFAAETGLGLPDATRIDGTVEFASPDEIAKTAGLDRVGSARWTGWIKAHVTGRFKFDGDSPAVQVIVSNVAMWGPEAAPSAEIHLSAGKYYPVRVDLTRVSTAWQPIRLRWTVPYGAHYVIPRQLLFLPTESVSSKS